MLGAFVFLLCIFYYFSSRRYLAVFLVFFLVTAGFQLVPLNYMVLPSAGIKKSYDWVLLFQGALFLLVPQYFFPAAVWKKFRILIVYGGLLVLLLAYSILMMQVESSVSIRVFRSLIFFITLFLFVSLSKDDLQKVFRLIIIFTSVAAVFYCLQVITGYTLLNHVVSGEVGFSAAGRTRFYNLPVFVYPVVFFLFFSKNLFTIRFKSLLLLVNGMVILLSQHRNLIMAVLACYFIYLIITWGLKFKSIVVFMIVGAGLLIGVNTFLKDRFTEGIKDISSTSFDASNPEFYYVQLSELSTTEFRQLLLIERFEYVSKNKLNALLGIGMLTDDSRAAQRLNFNIGMSDGYGNVAQVASSDIAWSTLLLQIGLLGIAVFILVHIFLLVNFYKQRHNAFMLAGLLYIISLFITSFYSNNIVLPYVTSLLMLFAAYHYRIVNTKT